MKYIDIKLINGSYKCLHSTIEGVLNFHKENNNKYYIGRTYEGISSLIKYIRGELIDFPLEHIEELFIHDILKISENVPIIVILNIGGIIFHIRKDVLLRSNYFKSFLKWNSPINTEINDTYYIDLTDKYIDRDPELFLKVMKYIENPYCNNLDDIPKQVQDYYGISEMSDYCLLCDSRNSDIYMICNDCLVRNKDLNIYIPTLPCKQNKYNENEITNIPNYISIRPLMDNIANYIGITRRNIQNLIFDDTSLFPHNNSIYKHQGYIRYPPSSTSFVILKCSHMDNNLWDFKYEYDNGNLNFHILGDSYFIVDINTCISNQDIFYDVIDKFTLYINDDIIDTYSSNILRIMQNKYKEQIKFTYYKKDSNIYTRVIYPLYFFYYKTPELYLKKLTLREQNITLSLHISNIYINNIIDVSLQSMHIYLDNNEIRHIREHPHGHPYEHVVFLHQEQCESFVVENDIDDIIIPLHLKGICEDIILYLKPQDSIELYEPIEDISLLIDGQVYTSLVGYISRNVIANDIYGIPNNKDYIYYIPFNTEIKNKKMISTFNFDENLDSQLHLRICKGSYKLIITNRYCNVLRVTNGNIVFVY